MIREGLNLTRSLGLYVDYTRHDMDDADIDGVSVGGKVRF